MTRWIVLLLAICGLLSAAEKKIVITGTERHWWAVNDQTIPRYREAAAGARLVIARSPEEFEREIVDADGIVGELSREQFLMTRNLKWMQEYSAGVEDYGYKEFQESDVILTNCKIVQGPTIADHAFALLLTLTRNLNLYRANSLKEEWSRDPAGMIELLDKTAVIIGVGGIGSQIAQRAHGFGMRVIGVDPKEIAPGNLISRIVPPDDLDRVLPEADVVFVAAPHTPETEGMIGPRQFELMKQRSYFIAVSRGKLYDMPALVKALDSRKLAGAGVDVTDPEPLPKGHPLWKFSNVIITPHAASQSPGGNERRIGIVTENLGRFVRDQPLRNVVDKQKGY